MPWWSFLIIGLLILGWSGFMTYVVIYGVETVIGVKHGWFEEKDESEIGFM